jgi:hypothetical protein
LSGGVRQPVDPASAAPLSQRSRRSRRHQRLTLFVAVSALLTAMAAVGVIGYGALHWRHLLASEDGAAEQEAETTKRAGLAPKPDDEPDADKPPPSFRQTTQTKARGAIEVIDVGVETTRLEELMAFHAEVAKSKGQKLLVMTITSRCAPCDGVDVALDDPRMQKSLDGVRLLRIDLEAFEPELEALHFPTALYPAFFTVGADMRPIDAIHGGEWDDDVAKNIAPILGAFVDGDYLRRRHPEWRPTTTSIEL